MGALAVAATAIAIRQLVLTDAGLPGSRGPTRVALIRMWDPGSLDSRDEAGWRPFVGGLVEAERRHGVETEIVDLFPRRPPSGGFEQGSQEDVERLSARLRSGEFDLVLWPLGLTGPPFFDVVRKYPDTRFVFLDYCCATGLELRGAPNATALTLRGGQAAHLAGYLSGLIEARRTPQGGRHVVSIISGDRTSHSSRHWFKGSQRGCGAPFRAWRFTVTTRSSTTTRRPARGSRTGRSTAAHPSFSPLQAIARSARSRLPAFAACGASPAARISRTSARTFSRPRPSATIASSTWQ